MPHVSLRRAVRIHRRALYVDPQLEQLLRDGIRSHRQHPELCRNGTCRAAIEAAQVIATARAKRGRL